MKQRVKQWLSKLTLAQKARLVSGADWWRLVSYEKMGIPSIMVSDGPHGLRTQKQNPQPFGPDDSIPATCFPSGATLASSWDRKVLATVGKALGDEAKAEGVSVVLGPAVNIKRSPLCGRNFEYYSEDPFLATQCATAYIKGMQDEGVGTSLKHFCANNQEDHRLTIDEHIDERTLREIYLSAFETAVKEAKPWTIMASYNKINGSYACEHPYTLRHVLRDEWKYRGSGDVRLGRHQRPGRRTQERTGSGNAGKRTD
jgi:beta-glucosidase